MKDQKGIITQSKVLLLKGNADNILKFLLIRENLFDLLAKRGHNNQQTDVFVVLETIHQRVH
jgi:hypothetical protein